MKIAIPSYKRQNELCSKTLKLLKEYKIENNEIDLFVANQEEYDNYKQVVPDDINIIIGLKGIKNIREFMSNYYDEGEEIVYFDDDIETIEQLVIDENGKKKKEKIKDLRKVIKEGFDLCKKHQYKNWGVYPVYNAFFMNNSVSTDLKYVIGCFTGVINDRECEKRSVGHGEDYERTIRYYLKYNGLIRMNYITIKSKYFAKGGIDAEYEGKRNECILGELEKLKNLYPSLLTIKKKDKYHNPVLKDKRENQVSEFLD